MHKNVTGPSGAKTITDLRQIRALADPLRLRILELLVKEPRTTKQIADILREKHTKLYHHMQTLERAKIIRLTGTHRKRGTIEKYYQARAAMFRAAPSLFDLSAGRSGQKLPLEGMLDTLLSSARADVLRYIAGDSDIPQKRKKILAARLLVAGRRRKVLAAIHRRLAASLDVKEIESTATKNGKDGKQSYAVTIIVCPVESA